jgi:hypothetical protein
VAAGLYEVWGEPGAGEADDAERIAAVRGLRPEELRELVCLALEPSLKPRLYREALTLVERHRVRGEPLRRGFSGLHSVLDFASVPRRLLAD